MGPAQRRLLRALQRLRTFVVVPPALLQRALAWLRADSPGSPAAQTAAPERAPHTPTAAHSADPNQPGRQRLRAPVSPQRAWDETPDSYVDHAGLVVLWPFLLPLFRNLGLVEEQQFVDRAAIHRAVGVLHHLATLETAPQEYQVALPRVLCGLPFSEVLDFGDPVTDAESAECSRVLGAAIAHASALGDPAEMEFRARFIQVRGALSLRQDSFLLRLERGVDPSLWAQLPWPLAWVRLPWLDRPIRVEW
jgi:hypothetical protein